MTSRRRRVVLGLATIWLTGCATVGSDDGAQGERPPVIAFSWEFKARAAEELVLLPEGSVIVDMLADFVVIREQARLCSRP